MIAVLSFLIVLGIIIVVHEWGHFYAARRNGVRVETFSIGFGPKLLSRKVGDTQFVISLIPLGGYIKMAGHDLSEAKNLPDEFNSKTVWQRAEIILAGPLINLLLAIFAMPLVYLIGTSVPVYLSHAPKIGWVEGHSDGAKAGLVSGDRITAINDTSVSNWEGVFETLDRNSSHGVKLTVSRGPEQKEVIIQSEISGAGKSGSFLGIYPEAATIITKVMSKGAAAGAGIQPGDKVVSLQGTPIAHWSQFLSLIRENANRNIELIVDRNGEPVSTHLTPTLDPASKRVLIGVGMSAETEIRQFGLVQSFKKGFNDLQNMVVMTGVFLKKLFTGRSSVDTLGGPIQIAQITGQAAKAGIGPLIFIMAAISLQLGMFNLLPIPALDGGWLLILLLEAMIGRPINKKVVHYVQSFGISALIVLMLVVSYHDLMKIGAR